MNGEAMARDGPQSHKTKQFFHRIIKHVIWLQNLYVLPAKYLFFLTTTTLSVEILGQKRAA